MHIHFKEKCWKTEQGASEAGREWKGDRETGNNGEGEVCIELQTGRRPSLSDGLHVHVSCRLIGEPGSTSGTIRPSLQTRV